MRLRYLNLSVRISPTMALSFLWTRRGAVSLVTRTRRWWIFSVMTMHETPDSFRSPVGK